MPAPVPTLHHLRLELRQAWLRRRERHALRRFGEAVVASGASGGNPEVARRRAEIAGELVRMEALAGDTSAPGGMRGLYARVAQRRRRAAMRRRLASHYEATGALAATSAEFWYPLEREVAAVRASLARLAAERVRRQELRPAG